MCRHAGNLLVLQDQQGRPSGQVGFIDFGIVGRVTPVTWTALEALMTATATRDFETMARALATVGAIDTDVDVKVYLPPLYMLLWLKFESTLLWLHVLLRQWPLPLYFSWRLHYQICLHFISKSTQARGMISICTLSTLAFTYRDVGVDLRCL